MPEALNMQDISEIGLFIGLFRALFLHLTLLSAVPEALHKQDIILADALVMFARARAELEREPELQAMLAEQKKAYADAQVPY